MEDLYAHPGTPETTHCAVSQASKKIGELVNLAYIARHRIVITFHGHPRAILVSAMEFAEMEYELAATRRRLREIAIREAAQEEDRR